MITMAIARNRSFQHKSQITQLPKPRDPSQNNGYYIVERILDDRGKGKSKQYLVK